MYKCLNANSTLPKKGNTEQRAKNFLSSGATTHKQTLSPKRNFWKSYRLVKNGFHVNGPRHVDAYACYVSYCFTWTTNNVKRQPAISIHMPRHDTRRRGRFSLHTRNFVPHPVMAAVGKSFWRLAAENRRRTGARRGRFQIG